MSRNRLSDIDRLKGIVIIFVVWGHVYISTLPNWALLIRQGLYSFHMPLFMFLSGYVFVYASQGKQRAPLLSVIAKRANRLLIPFFAVALILIAGKIAAQSAITVTKPVTGIYDAAVSLVFGTEKSVVLSIWYLCVLFYFSIITDILYMRLKLRLETIFIASIFMHLLHLYLFYQGITLDFAYFNRILMYYVFFMAGAVAMQYITRWEPFIDKNWYLFVLPFVVSLCFLITIEVRYIVVGLIAVPLLHGISRTRVLEKAIVFDWLGKYALSIYLLNLAFVGVGIGILTKILDPQQFGLVYIVVCTVVGVLGPIAVKATIDRFKRLRFIARYME